MRNKVLKAKGLCASDATDVSVRRQFESKFFGFRTKIESLLGITCTKNYMTITFFSNRILERNYSDNKDWLAVQNGDMTAARVSREVNAVIQWDRSDVTAVPLMLDNYTCYRSV